MRTLPLALITCLAALALPGCSDDDGEQPPPGPETYLLVHGAFAGAWSWDEVAPLIEATGARTVTLDLPSHGEDDTDVADATLQSYTDKVVEALDAEAAPVILVGHSMGGLVVSQAAEARPAKVKKLVYLAAFLVKDGTSLLTASANDAESQLGMYVTLNNDNTTTLAEDGIQGAFCSDCDADQTELVASHLKNEPLAPFTENIHTTAANWGSVPRVYIQTLADKAIGPTRQEEFFTALPCERVITIDSGHCPFITKPDEVADALTSL